MAIAVITTAEAGVDASLSALPPVCHVDPAYYSCCCSSIVVEFGKDAGIEIEPYAHLSNRLSAFSN